MIALLIASFCFSLSGFTSDARIVKRQSARIGSDPDCMCLDYYGSCRKVNTEWVDDDTWIYSCSKMGIREIGCKATARGNSMTITMGQNTTINGFWYSCKRSKNKIKYSQEHSCEISGNQYHVGDTINDGYFVWQCFAYGIGTSGCRFRDKTSDKADFVKLEIGETKTIGCYNHTCKVAMRHPWTLRYIAKPLEDCLYVSGEEDEREKLSLSKLADEVQSIIDLPDQPPIHAAIYSASFVRSDDTSDEKIRYTN